MVDARVVDAHDHPARTRVGGASVPASELRDDDVAESAGPAATGVMDIEAPVVRVVRVERETQESALVIARRTWVDDGIAEIEEHPALAPLAILEPRPLDLPRLLDDEESARGVGVRDEDRMRVTTQDRLERHVTAAAPAGEIPMNSMNAAVAATISRSSLGPSDAPHEGRPPDDTRLPRRDRSRRHRASAPRRWRSPYHRQAAR